MQVNAIETNQQAFGSLQINDCKISKNYKKAIQYEIDNEVRKLDKQGFDIVIENNSYPDEYGERRTSDVFLKSKTEDKELYISTLYRDTHHSFSNSLKTVKTLLSALS